MYLCNKLSGNRSGLEDSSLNTLTYVHFFLEENMEERYMLMAIEEAKKALELGEVPVGAVIVKDGKVIAKAYNKKESEQKVTSHAEIIAIEEASFKLKNWRLNNCVMYVTLEPCPMCASAIKQARISTLYYGLSNKDINNKIIINSIFDKDNINPRVNVNCGYFENEIDKMLKKFFKGRRG